ncbi:MAG TPA: hypothetical protein VMU48_15315 [Terracidiphilus sp.]|nr:hypothetical protein [Terracidiphilus sp.]
MTIKHENFRTSQAARARRMRQLAAERPRNKSEADAAIDLLRPADVEPPSGENPYARIRRRIDEENAKAGNQALHSPQDALAGER